MDKTNGNKVIKKLSVDITRKGLSMYLKGDIEDINRTDEYTEYITDFGRLRFKRSGDYIFLDLLSTDGQFISFDYEGWVKTREVETDACDISYEGKDCENEWIDAEYELPDGTTVMITVDYYYLKS